MNTMMEHEPVPSTSFQGTVERASEACGHLKDVIESTKKHHMQLFKKAKASKKTMKRRNSALNEARNRGQPAAKKLRNEHSYSAYD